MKSKLTKARMFEIIKFGFTGGVCFLIDYGIMVLLTDVFGVHYLVSSGISFTVSVVINYMMCVQWVFKSDKKQSRKAVLIFVGSSIVGLFLNQIFMWLFVDLIRVDYKISKIIATILVMIWNYFAKRKAISL